MTDWFTTLGVAEKIFFFVAVPSTLILLIQTILALFGIGDGSTPDLDADADFDGDGISDGDGLAIFSVRGIISFFCVMGWSGFILLGTGIYKELGIVIAVALGLLAFFAVAVMNKLMNRLQSQGNILPENAVGKSGQVYLQIPPSGGGTGKVNLVVQDRLTEFTAVTTEALPIKTGATVKVVAASETGVLTVISSEL